MRSRAGFTLVEILVVVVVIGILVMTILPNWLNSENKAKVAGVKENMHAAQLCAEQYKTDAGVYPSSPSGLDPFYPGGGNTPGGAAGNRPTNPVTAAPNEALYSESLSTFTDVQNLRNSAPSTASGSKGQVGYAQLASGDGYAVCGLDDAGKRIASQTGTLVLSNE